MTKAPKTKACKPTPGEPDDYIDRGVWMADRLAKGWKQERCRKCGFWHIWIPPKKKSR